MTQKSHNISFIAARALDHKYWQSSTVEILKEIVNVSGYFGQVEEGIILDGISNFCVLNSVLCRCVYLVCTVSVRWTVSDKFNHLTL